MLNLLKWDKPLMINGIIYNNSTEAYDSLKDTPDMDITIELNIDVQQQNKDTNNITGNSIENIEVERIYTFTVKKWFAKRNDCPMIMEGFIDEETTKAIKIFARGFVEKSVKCCMCGRTLSNENSRLIGIGPVCASNLGVSYDVDNLEDIERARGLLEEKTYEMWIPKSQVIFEEL